MKILIDIEDGVVETPVVKWVREQHQAVFDKQFLQEIKLVLESASLIVNSIEDITNANLRPTDFTPTPPSTS